MNEYTVKLKMPHCEDCSKRKITDAEGKTRFVRKGISVPVLASVAAETTQSLADRLKLTVNEDIEDDI
jgi:hypothetical protein